MALPTAVWFEHDTGFINLMKPVMPDHLELTHLTELHEHRVNEIPWHSVQLLISELKVQDVEALHFIHNIREKNKSLPIILITQHATKEDCIKAINLGVNGLIEKPVSAEDLKKIISKHVVRGVSLKLSEERKAVLSPNGWVDLTSTEYKIIDALKNAHRRLTRAELQAAVWPGSTISENNLDTHLTNLKRKIPELNHCLNVKRGLGYFLNVEQE